jgi:hypothetical protein
MEIKRFLSRYLPILFLIGSLVILSAGCEKKAEKPEGENASKDTMNMVMPEEPKPDTLKKYPDLTGTWTGSFESHGATFKITEQKDSTFMASLTVAYRQPMNKSISGTIDLSSNKITMKDVEKSRTESTYKAELSGDGQKISGTSTLKISGNKANFSFKKK